MWGRRQELSLGSQFHPPEFDIELRDELHERIQLKTGMLPPESIDLARGIASYIGNLCSAFEEGFIDEIDVRVGSEDYGVRVFMSKDNQRTI